jgi:hypothetical protein
VLRKICGRKSEEEGHGENCIMLNFIVYILHLILAGDYIKEEGVSRTCGSHGRGEKGVYTVLVWRPEGRKPLGRQRRRWEDNIKINFREMGIDGAN